MLIRPIRRRSCPAGAEQALPASLHPVLRRVYASRDVECDQLDASLARLLPVGELRGAVDAVARLMVARQRGERILVIGDFDADGATASALMVDGLRRLGFANAGFLVPDRFRFGYGLSPAIAEHAAGLGPELLITVDNGISSLAGVERAAELGMDVIVTDHHLPGERLPSAVAVVNPNSPGEPFSGKNLAGVGVAFYLVAALGRALADDGLIDADAARQAATAGLDLVALGTVADLVPMDYNNRILVEQGLRRMRAGAARPGIQALFEVAGRNILTVRSTDLGFGIAPRLNAAGRLTDMSVGIECLLAASLAQALPLAQRLDRLNNERRELQQQMEADAHEHVAAARRRIEERPADAYCLYDPDWHEGVVGLVASRIKDAVNRPVIAFAPAEEAGMLKGSARSVSGVHIRDVLDRVAATHPELVPKFGGHAMAAGLSLRHADLPRFTEAFLAALEPFQAVLEQPDVIWSDGGLEPGHFGLELASAIATGGPWGQGFPEPLFDDELEVVSMRVLKDRHLKLGLRHPAGTEPIDAIAFNCAELPAGSGPLRFCYRLDLNEFRGQSRPQLIVEDIRRDTVVG